MQRDFGIEPLEENCCKLNSAELISKAKQIMSVVISDDILQAARMSEAQLKREIAIILYQQRKLSTGKARHLAGMNLIEFQQELANRGIYINYDVEDFESDLETLRKLGDL